MATVRCAFDPKYPFETYEDVLKAHDWLKECLEYAFFDIPNVTIHEWVEFHSQGADYECASIDEFKDLAYGHQIEPINLYVRASVNDRELICLHYDGGKQRAAS